MNLIKIFIIICMLSVAVHAKGRKNNKKKHFEVSPTSNPTTAFVAACRQYQNTEATVEAFFEDGVNVQRVFVTDMVDLDSSKPEVASIYRGNKILGHSIGNSTVSVNVPNDKVIITPDTVEVSSVSVNLINLQISAITDAKNLDDRVRETDMYGLADVDFALSQVLTFDGMSAGISVYANFSDGSYMDVSENATIVSLNSDIATSEDAYGPLMTVVDYAHSNSGEFLEASYPVCYRQADPVNTGFVMLDIVPVKVDLIPQFHDLAHKMNLAARYPFYLPQMTYLQVAIHFADGSVRNMTDGFLPGLNSRASLVIMSGGEYVTISENLLAVRNDVDKFVNGTVLLNVSFPGLYGVTSTCEVDLAAYEDTSVTLTSFPSNPGILKNTVYLLGCCEKKQRLQVMALGVLTNHMIKDVTAVAGFSESDQNDASVGHTYAVGNYTLFVGLSEGTVFVGARYEEYYSVWTPIHVVEQHTEVIQIEMYGHAPNDTMRGYPFSEWNFLRAKLHFEDGTYYPDVLYGVTREWVNASDLIWLNSTQPEAATVDNTGNIMLVGNYYDKIFFQAHVNCSGSTVTDESFAFSNLVPRVFDFDMGSSVGPKFGTVLVDAPFVVPIGVQARPGLPITTFHMVMKFDADIIEVPNDDEGCLMDPDWSGFFECTTNNPPNQVHIAGICGAGGCDAEGLVKFANIDFRTKTVGKSIVTGEIVRAGDQDEHVGNKTILAGSDDVLLATATPSSQPTGEPSGQPTSRPSSVPTSRPTSIPTCIPTGVPTSVPSSAPTISPTPAPSTPAPTVRPTFTVTSRPTAHPTKSPTHMPTPVPSARPTPAPSARPTKNPTRAPTRKPTKQPTAQPTRQPTTGHPSKIPTPAPTRKPTRAPTSTRPTRVPSFHPTEEPTYHPTLEPTLHPTERPTLEPTAHPSVSPTLRPTRAPTVRPTLRPSKRPTAVPTRKPTAIPTTKPTAVPSTQRPTSIPTAKPTTATPTRKPTKVPTQRPTSGAPTTMPSAVPTVVPTSVPSSVPTSYPTGGPTRTPVQHPTSIPTSIPSSVPTRAPTTLKTASPTLFPRAAPTFRPTTTKRPTRAPTFTRTGRPSGDPTSRPTSIPTQMPLVPTSAPSSSPSFRPTSIPSVSPTSVPTSIPTRAPISSQPSGAPTLMPTLYVKMGYNFSRECSAPATGNVDVDLTGTEEICSDLPAFGDISLLTSSLRAIAHESGYTPLYSIVVSDPLGTHSVRFGEQDMPLDGYSYLSATTRASSFHYWDVEYAFGAAGSFFKGTLEGDAVLSGIGLFKVCLVNVDPTDSRTTVSYSGSLLFSKTLYDCGIPLSGYVESSSPTGSPSSRPSEAPPSALPTSAPSFGAQADGINFNPKCDAAVAGEINLKDLPYMREGCGYFPGRGLQDLALVDLFYPVMFSENPVHVIIQDLSNNIAYRYGDSYVDISGAEDVSDLSKGADFIHFADGVDVGYMKSRKIAMPREGYEALSGTGWFAVCLINTGHDTSSEFLVTGGVSFLNYYIDCDVMFTQPLVLPSRRLRNLLATADDEEDPVFKPVAVKLPSYHHQQHAADVRDRLEEGDSAALMAHLQSTRDMFGTHADSYHIPAKQNSLHVLQELEEDDMELLYANPVSTTFEFAPRTQSFVVPDGTTTITVSACGGSGGGTARAAGGLGGCIKTIISVVPKQTLFITVGGEGQSHGVSGFHGGGIGSSATLGVASESNSAGGAGGGGASDVRLNSTDIFARLIVAGGGGGGGGIEDAVGGPGGGLVGGIGGFGATAITDKTFPPAGGSQSRGGSGAKYAGASCSFNEGYLGSGGTSSLGGGGGGGYYGGGGGCYSGGGGGSNHAVGSVVADLQGANEGPGLVRLTYNRPSHRDRVHSARILKGNKKASAPAIVNNGMVGESKECEFCVMGDVNQDCVFDAQDARELQQIVEYKRESDPRYTYTSCQRRAFDPNLDGAVSNKDVTYLLRVTTKRYRFFGGLQVAYDIDAGLHIEATVWERDGGLFNESSASVSISMITFQGPELELSEGVLDPAIQFPWGVQITPAYNPETGVHSIHTDYIGNEDDIALVVTISTTDDLGQGHASRQYTFYCSPLINHGKCIPGSTITHIAYYTFDIWGMPSRRPTGSPTISLTPTFSPTGEPTGQPSGQPSSAPTMMKITRSLTEYLVHPHIDALSGPALPHLAGAIPASRAVWAVPFNTMLGARPGTQSTFALSISGRQYATSSLTTARQAVVALVAVVKTAAVHIDARSIGVSYQASGGLGGTQVEPATPLSLVVTNVGLGQSAAFTCLSPDPLSGISACYGELSAQWWSDTGTVYVSAHVVVLSDPSVVSNNVEIALLRPPALLQDGDAPAPYVLLSLPPRPVAPAEVVEVEASANTGAEALTSWLLSVAYDASVLTYMGFSAGPAYTNPTVLHSGGRLVVSATGVSSNATLAALASGVDVDIGVFQMRVLVNASAGTCADAFSVVVLDAKSGSDNIGIEANSSALVQDLRGFINSTRGELVVQTNGPVGLLAYAPQSELLNTASFTGLAVHSAIVVEAVQSGASSTNEVVTADSQCSARADADEAMDIVGHCVVQLSGTKGVGAARALVDVTYSGLNTTVPFRVWHPSQLAVKVTDPYLQRIEA